MTKFWQLNEDPMYDEDGVLVDEDADWEDMEEEYDLPCTDELGITYDPFETVNS